MQDNSPSQCVQEACPSRCTLPYSQRPAAFPPFLSLSLFLPLSRSPSFSPPSPRPSKLSTSPLRGEAEETGEEQMRITGQGGEGQSERTEEGVTGQDCWRQGGGVHHWSPISTSSLTAISLSVSSGSWPRHCHQYQGPPPDPRESPGSTAQIHLLSLRLSLNSH
ncbi:unnamed protein product [Pleuronectes platessa]|uniref:Uncharacterized protein n=1 Tax=Pleuronectes platessa TaxID=8262 RepID=A0A9N7URG4_PLEPL|nr:unnamed protein product [Pleuronectes platessa]